MLMTSGCMGLLQPLDTHINKVFKDKVRKSFEFWYNNIGTKPENKTPKYLRNLSVKVVTGWVLAACDEIPTDLIRRSFKSCGISLSNSF